MANKPRHRRFGNIRKRASGRYQIRYPGPDGRMRTGPETYERKSDAERALSLIEVQMISGEWADSDRSKIKLEHYATYWITQRAGLRPRTVDLYTWLCGKHINPYLGGVRLGRLSTPMIQSAAQWGIGVNGSQGIPAAPLNPRDCCRRGQDPRS